ncbi:putative riboflavin kinase [Paramacrobiotus metropolitanus]|uniref:putative riboflavin kinase n=1 Tax=Paramacrobiotus metropolitanus TaxID=2943436 RepID=UPI00244599FC|nr:putative riboflavin kinase [Paramacrobiotus metropolitanus]
MCLKRLAFLPLMVEGQVVRGFGRGSKELGIPTANFTDEVVKKLPLEMENGVYFGLASVDAGAVDRMVLSVGWNPQFHNQLKTMETHILRDFSRDFYGSTLRVAVLGYIRPMTSFTSLDELIAAIKDDIRKANDELDKPEYAKYCSQDFFTRPLDSAAKENLPSKEGISDISNNSQEFRS